MWSTTTVVGIAVRRTRSCRFRQFENRPRCASRARRCGGGCLRATSRGVTTTNVRTNGNRTAAHASRPPSPELASGPPPRLRATSALVCRLRLSAIEPSPGYLAGGAFAWTITYGSCRAQEKSRSAGASPSASSHGVYLRSGALGNFASGTNPWQCAGIDARPSAAW